VGSTLTDRFKVIALVDSNRDREPTQGVSFGETPGDGTPRFAVSGKGNSMSNYETEAEERTAKRAQYEAFEMAVCPGVGKVNVVNKSYNDDKNHTYTVTVRDGEATGCSCPADEYQPGACKHRVAVESRQPVMLAASTEIVTDGGEDADEDTDECHACHGSGTTDAGQECFVCFDPEDY
jgi:hypothetical protein